LENENAQSAMLNKKRATPRSYEVAAVRKALEILCEFSPESPWLTVSDLSRRLQIPKSTAHNLLRTLQNLDFVAQDNDKRYRLGPRVFDLGLLFSDSARLVAHAVPHMRRLVDQTRETVKLGILSNSEVLVVRGIESPYQLHTRGDEGRRAALHSTGLGKAILASLQDAEVRDIVSQTGLSRFTSRTITNLRLLEQELAQIRIAGYALDWGENEDDVRCAAACIADSRTGAPAAISFSGPASRLTKDKIRQFATLLVEEAKAISRSMGGPDVKSREGTLGPTSEHGRVNKKSLTDFRPSI
jgi:DNA-binding IclR family transcriptional regulator